MRLTPALALLAACLSLVLAACGGDDGDGETAGQPQVFEISANEDGVTAPESVQAGAVEVRFSNTGERPHSAQIVPLEGHSPEEVLEAGEAWGESGEPLPEWLRFVGGVGSTRPAGAASAVVELAEGDYAVFDIEGEGEAPYAEFSVEGDADESLPEADSGIEAVEYAFESEGLEAGGRQVLFENTGDEPHHIVAAPIEEGSTIDDVRRALEDDEGEPPLDERRQFDTAILSGGERAVLDLQLEAGEYALLCFVPDRAGGPPHAFKGMVSSATVE